MKKINNLVIVESPGKIKTLEQFLGKDFKVMSSYGHIRDLKKNSLSLENGVEPEYEIPDDKVQVVNNLRKAASEASVVWLASDEDREGEAISWHLAQVLGLDLATTRRIVFHEITKTAILEAIEHPRHVDLNLVNAQQARRVLDRLVGFKLSPVLWKKIKPQLSAGRVQSVCVRLIVEREREIENFKAESSYKVVALFSDGTDEFRADLSQRFDTAAEAEAFLESVKDASFSVSDVQLKPVNRTPAPPFTTSTLQQEAARKLGFTVSQTMMVAQHLYEMGYITYMRTDSVNLSDLCINTSRSEITSLYGPSYSRPRRYHTNSKGAQEAHEAIRPAYIDRQTIKGSVQEKKLYELIRKRTLACQMADAVLERTVITIADNCGNTYTAEGEVVKFDGFLRVYEESRGDSDTGSEETSKMLPSLVAGQVLTFSEMTATEHYTQAPPRYTEGALTKKLEETGIGRPSTYAPTISTIQQREYVVKGNKPGMRRNYNVITLKKGKIKSVVKSELVGNDRGKLIPTDMGIIVNDFLMKYFPAIMDYNFTANVERDFDNIAEGKTEWKKMISAFDGEFSPLIKKTLSDKSDLKAGSRVLGTDPKSGKPVIVKIGRFGPVVQIGSIDDDEKPLFAQLPKDQTMSSITFDEAMELFRLPRTLGDFEGEPVKIGAGRFGPYILHKKVYTSLPKQYDPLSVTLEESIALIEERRKTEANKVIKTFDQDADLQVLNGRWGAYICYKGKNYKLPKAALAAPQDLTYEECVKIVNG